MSAVKLFISHSERDEPLVRPLAAWMQSGLGLSEAAIRCTVVTNMAVGGLPADVLRKDLKSASAVIGLLTANSLRSHWAQLEMGAGWLQERLHPVRGPGIYATDLPSPLSDFTTVGYCDKNGMLRLVHQLAGLLDASVSDDAATEFDAIARSAQEDLLQQRVCWFSLPPVLSASRLDSVSFNYELLSLCSGLDLQPADLRHCTSATGVITRDPEHLPLWASDLWQLSKNAVNFMLSSTATDASTFLDVPPGALDDRLVAELIRVLQSRDDREGRVRHWFEKACRWIADNPPAPRRSHGGNRHYQK